MNHLQSFKDKIKELEDIDLRAIKLRVELNEDLNELITLIVEILDDMTPDYIEKNFKLNIKYKTILIFKIVNNKSNLKDTSSVYLHSRGLGTIVHWKDKYGGDKNESLWNLNNSENYKLIAEILDELIKKYNKVYKAVLLKKDSNKYNL